MDHLTATDVARRLGISPSTWRAYVAREKAPAPDETVGPLNLWRAETVDAWQRARRGRGWRKSTPALSACGRERCPGCAVCAGTGSRVH